VSRAAFEAEVRGRVQGVGFRYYACSEAKRLGVAGWIRNKRDGSVSVHAEGEADRLEAFLSWLREGPPHSRVDSVDVRRLDAAGAYKAFIVDYD
jgi:acylphosphatase